MNTVTINSSLVAYYDKETEKLEYYLIKPNMTWAVGASEVVILEDLKLSVIVPELSQTEFAQKAVNTLRQKQAKAWADAQQTVNNFQRQIDELLLLTYQPEPIQVFTSAGEGLENPVILEVPENEVEPEDDSDEINF